MLGTWDLGFAPHWQDFDGPTEVRGFAGDAVSRGLTEGAFAVGFPLAKPLPGTKIPNNYPGPP